MLRLAAAPAGIMIEVVGTRIRAAEPDDRPALEPFLACWHALRVARPGELVHPLDHPMLVAEENGRLVGVLTYVVEGADCEVLTLPWTAGGAGSAAR